MAARNAKTKGEAKSKSKSKKKGKVEEIAPAGELPRALRSVVRSPPMGEFTPLIPAVIDRGDGFHQTWLIDGRDEAYIAAALDGDWSAARSLLDSFADEIEWASPALIAFVAACVRDWKKSEYDADAAPRAFRVAAPFARRSDPRTHEKHAAAIEAYLRLIGDRVKRDFALDRAGRAVGLADSTLRDLLLGMSKPDVPFTAPQRSAIRSLDMEGHLIERHAESTLPPPLDRLRPAVDLRRCLGRRAFEKWQRYKQEQHERIIAALKTRGARRKPPPRK